MKLKFIKVGLLAVLAGLLTPIAVMAIAHSDIFGCNGCHTPHNAKALPGVPLWNGSETTATFTMYSSDTFQGIMDGQPSGDSKLCLSCLPVNFLLLVIWPLINRSTSMSLIKLEHE